MAETNSYYRLSSGARMAAVPQKLATITGVSASPVPHYSNIIHVEYPRGHAPDADVLAVDPQAQLEHNTTPE
jgi:hypothetical protein